MKFGYAFLLSALALAGIQPASAEAASMTLQKTIQAGAAFSIQCTGSGKATLYIVGPGQVFKRDVQLGEAAFFLAGSLYNAGRYLAVLETESSSSSDAFDVVSTEKPAYLSFIAKPSRLPVGQPDGITGAVYVFDAYRNLIAVPMPVWFELSNPSGTLRKQMVNTRDGAAWTVMDSTTQKGIDRFVARIAGITSTRIIEQVPGNPCGLKVSARQSGQKVLLATEPVRDCNGNAVPDGTIVTFTESYNGGQSSADVPLKHGIAEMQISGHAGSTISVASGVVLGNQIRWRQ